MRLINTLLKIKYLAVPLLQETLFGNGALNELAEKTFILINPIKPITSSDTKKIIDKKNAMSVKTF